MKQLYVKASKDVQAACAALRCQGRPQGCARKDFAEEASDSAQPRGCRQQSGHNELY